MPNCRHDVQIGQPWPRTTQDVDLVIAPTLGSLHRLISEFPEDRYYVSREAALQAYGSESLFNVIDLNSGWKIDFIVRKSRPFSVEKTAMVSACTSMPTNRAIFAMTGSFHV